MSAGLRINLSNYRDRSGDIVPEGTYRVQVEDIEQGETRKGDPKFVLYLRVMAPGTDHDGSTIVEQLVQVDAALWRTVAFLKAIRVPTPKKDLTIPEQMLRGKTLIVDVEDDEYNGRVRSAVKTFKMDDAAAGENTASGGTMPDLPTSEDSLPSEESAEAPVTEDGSLSLDDLSI